MSAFEKLTDAHAELYAAIRVVEKHGRPADLSHPFDLALNVAIDDAARISEQLPEILCNARLDEQVAHMEILKDAQTRRNSDLALWALWEEIHKEIEKRDDLDSMIELVERTLLYRIAGLVARALESTN